MQGCVMIFVSYFFFQAEDGIRDYKVTGVQTCALPISSRRLPGRTDCWRGLCGYAAAPASAGTAGRSARPPRSAKTEEGRGGEEGRSPGGPYHLKKKKKIH